MKKKYLIIIAAVVALCLAVVFFSGRGKKIYDAPIELKETALPTEAEKKTITAPTVTEAPKLYEEPTKTAVPPQKAEQATESAEPKKAEETPELMEEKLCTISVNCGTILNNRDKISAEKLELIPPDGVILPEAELEFSDGESVFDVTVRELRKKNIHYEFSKTPIYKTAYTEGISNIYELDCGELSGWMYRVNGEFPNVGCSRYVLKSGDKIEWLYTCNLGADIGGAFGAGGQRDE